MNDEGKLHRRSSRSAALFDKSLVKTAALHSITMLNPKIMARNPVMFVTEIGAALTTMIAVRDMISHGKGIGYTIAVTVILWLTVLFANFAEALAEARGKAQADTLKRTRQSTKAMRIVNGIRESVSSDDLRQGDIAVSYTHLTLPTILRV